MHEIFWQTILALIRQFNHVLVFSLINLSLDQLVRNKKDSMFQKLYQVWVKILTLKLCMCANAQMSTGPYREQFYIDR
ncbi:hypothetical protein BRADI_1g63505v3 [Brachypodium distachyon]|uniref:Uncharacterized protein n=1 Tax=Brachypodium distachyon TaxID=15368 RepID=A0A0Q3SA98_BRADI|nr:hypothetical protein BRADI_1g63505v3 [Brachypodium distachyon]